MSAPIVKKNVSAPQGINKAYTRHLKTKSCEQMRNDSSNSIISKSMDYNDENGGPDEEESVTTDKKANT